MSDMIKISAKRIPDHEPASSVVRLITWVGELGTEEKSIFDILELGQSTNESKTRKDLLLEIDRLLDQSDVVSLTLEIISR